MPQSKDLKVTSGINFSNSLKNPTQLQDYTGTWTCELWSYSEWHEDEKKFGKGVNGSIYVNVVQHSGLTTTTKGNVIKTN